MNWKNWFCAALVGAFLGCFQPGALASGYYEDGLRFYTAGRYQEALFNLSQAAGALPASPMVHYYLANTLARLRMHPQAIAEYEICYRLDPYSSVASYCQQALGAYRRPLPALPSAQPRAARVNTERVYKTVSGFEEPYNVDRTKSIIRRQAAFEKNKHGADGEVFADSVIRQAESEARRIQEEAAEEKQRIFNPPPVVSRGGIFIPPPPSPELVRMRAQEVEKQTKERIERTRMVAENKANEYRRWSKDRQNALDEVVSNLESQLDAPLRPGGAKLQSVGTDLYVRYYGYSNEARPPREVRPAVLRIVGHQAEQGALPPQELEGESKPLKVIKRVRGAVIGAPLTPLPSPGYDPR